VGGGRTISYDDEQSAAEKCAYAKSKGMSGVIMWALGQDLYAGRPVLLDAIARTMGVPAADPPIDYLKKYDDRRISDARKLTQEIVKAEGELARLDKGHEHKPSNPLSAFSGLGGPTSDRAALGARIEKAEMLVYRLTKQFDEVQDALDRLPLAYRAGKLVKAEGPTLVISSFDDGGLAHKLGGAWESEFDRNDRGTTLNPSPLKPTAGGHNGSPYFLRFWGHFGKSGPPWPYADVGASMPPSDLSQWKGVRFAAKGNGKNYLLVVRRAAVRDYGQFRAQFSTSADWTEVQIPFADLQQPDWAHPVPRGWVDVTSIAFMPGALFSDEDYDLGIDDVELFK
jgi:hypothetical protein